MVGRIKTASGVPIDIRIWCRQLFHQPDHVVAEIAKDPGGHRRQTLRHIDFAFLDQRAECRKRRIVLRLEGIRFRTRGAIDVGLVAIDAENEIGIEPDDRVAAAHRAAFNGLKQEGWMPLAREFQIRRDRCLEIGNQRRPNKLGLAFGIARAECAFVRQDLHGIIFRRR